MSDYFKIYGCERTCTNFWRKLLLENFDGYDHISHPWVHGPVLDRDQWLIESTPEETLHSEWSDHNVDFFITTKNPCAWMVSLGRAFGDELNENTYTHDQVTVMNGLSEKMGESDPESLRHSRNVMTRFAVKWNIRHRNYREQLRQNDSFMLIRHEDILVDPKPWLERTRECFDLDVEGDTWTNMTNRVNPIIEDEPKESDEDFDRRYYTDNRYLDDLTDAMDIALDAINWDLARDFGYSDHRRSLRAVY